MKDGKIQAKDIPDQALLDLIDRLYNMPRMMVTRTGTEAYYSSGAHINVILKHWDNIPEKVIIAKLDKLEKAGKVDEMSHYYTVVHKGEEMTELYFDEFVGLWKTRQITRMGNRIRGQ